jgi:hypothetical protein
MNSSPDAPWKDGRERSDRWKETLIKGFLPRVSDGTGSPGGLGRYLRLLEATNEDADSKKLVLLLSVYHSVKY